jgi:hypothetical protein
MGCALFAAIFAFGVMIVLTPSPYVALPERIFFASVGMLAGFLTFSIFWIPTRFWAPPPVSLSVSPQGLGFRLRDGRQLTRSWDTSTLWIELLRRTGPSPLPAEADYRLWVTRGDTDYRLAWRRVVPLTYLTEAAFDSVLHAAEDAHVSVERVDSARSLSLLKPVTKTAFVIRAIA